MIQCHVRKRPAVHATAALVLVLVGCRHSLPIGSQPIPSAESAPWRTVLADPGFRVAMDPTDVRRGPEGGWIVWFITEHATPQGLAAQRFDRGRIRLLVRCDPLAFKSMSEELALGGSPPVFHQEWPLDGPDAASWRIPQAGSTDDRFLRATCALLAQRP